jgi:hypothetical protein
MLDDHSNMQFVSYLQLNMVPPFSVVDCLGFLSWNLKKNCEITISGLIMLLAMPKSKYQETATCYSHILLLAIRSKYFEMQGESLKADSFLSAFSLSINLCIIYIKFLFINKISNG